MGFSLETSVPVLTVFVQGLLSFFSPCVLPLVPLYVSYLAGGARTVGEDGIIRYPRGRVMVNTLFFVLGVSFTFVALGFGFTALGRFFSGNRVWFARVSGAIMILFGLYQLGIFGKSEAVEQEHRLPLRLDKWAMNPITALVLGFTFSFAWTPCVGPTLGSVLLMASSAGTAGAGFLLIGVYTLGFVIPFLAVGLFTGAVLGFFKRHQKVVRYTVKVGAVLLILMGIMTITGYMNGLASYLATVGGGTSQSQTGDQGTAGSTDQSSEGTQPEGNTSSSAEETVLVPAPDFTLTDQYGNTHTISDYKGKTVFLNFWATWCGPCKSEMPEIQDMYEDYGENQGDLVVLGVANPKSADHPTSQDVSQEEVEQFLTDNGYTFPVLMDTAGELFGMYGIRAFPTTFMIDADGNVFGYVIRSLNREQMESIVHQTMTGEREEG